MRDCWKPYSANQSPTHWEKDYFGSALKAFALDGFVKDSNSRRANFVIMRRTYCTLNGCGMRHNAEVGFFTKPSNLGPEIITNTDEAMGGVIGYCGGSVCDGYFRIGSRHFQFQGK